MKILQLHNRQLLVGGGADAVVEYERGLLRSAGHDVEVLIVDNRETLERSSRARAAAKSVWNLSAARDVGRAIESFAPEVVHVHTPFPLMSPAVFRVAARRGVATVATVHSFRYSCVKAVFYRDGRVCEDCLGRAVKLPAIRHRCYHDSALGSTALVTSLAVHRLLGTFRDDVDAWIAPSDFMRSKLVAEGLPAQKVVTKPYTIPDPGYRRDAVGDHALFAGRLEPEKGLETLLDAWQLMRDAPPLTVAGDGSLRDLVQRAAARDDRITFKGWLDQRALAAELAVARFLILSSEWYEASLPVVAIQAIAAGTPIIASDVGNFSEAIRPGDNGFLFQSGSADSLAAVVERAWGVDDRRSLAAGARQTYLDRHSEEHGAEWLEAVYRLALAERDERWAPALELDPSTVPTR